MATEHIVDASAVAKLFLDEPGAETFRDWWYGALLTDTPMSAPGLLRYEIGALIVRNLGHLDSPARRRTWREAVAGIRFDDETVLDALTVDGLTFYDAAYVALAATKKARLITYDDKMAKHARAHGVAVERP
ncbi:MAG: type II toxin-antitoxin system VapC family toxin [Euryarchaeota archaeon]|nr:type II toxin-antitoxin system VapC family toxin [Euryarchaeota archaeon]